MSTLYHSKLFWFLPLVIAGLLVGMYVFQLNALTALAYHIADQEQLATQLKQDVTQLEIRARHTFSLNDLEELAQNMQFEKITNISYLKIPTGGVAANQP
ncbi:MAG TPA: hypothetical protein VFE94_00410 [Candidatus Paceibacterota bacterium]|nr:hypothetical protein [Candidatus Paceibacterota bacterium]